MAVILGIDTSCDDTAVGIIRADVQPDAAKPQLLANVVASQHALHARFGGVVPEQASREHLACIDAVLQQALEQAQLPLEKIDALAVTYGPGLVGALLVGLNYGKALAWARNIPLFPIHHLAGHVAACTLHEGSEPLAAPFLCLIASGGHTVLFDVPAWGVYLELGKSRDDAAGEAFDKVARLLALGYPGGPALSAAAQTGDPRRYPLPVPLKQQQGFDFSFSGLKTAVATLLQRQPDASAADVAASFEHTVVESLYQVCLRAAQQQGYTKLVVAGGVAANRRLRQRFADSGLEVIFPPLALSTDNGAMIALAAWQQWRAGDVPPPETWQSCDAMPYLPLAESS